MDLLTRDVTQVGRIEPTANGPPFPGHATGVSGRRGARLESRAPAESAKALDSETVSPAEAFARWLSILKEINRRHGQGSMPTDVYYRLNTQLLELIPEPSPELG